MELTPKATIGYRARHSAFSLVEVALALGIFAFSMVAMLGLMPVALQASRDSMDLAIASQVAEMIATQLQQEGIATPAPTRFYLDELGRIEKEAGDALFQADLAYKTSGVENLQQVQISISKRGAPQRHFPFLIFNHR